MAIDDAEVRRIARLAYLELPARTGESLLSAAETARLGAELGAILDYVKTLAELDLEGVPATSHAVPLGTQTRPDEPGPSWPREEALAAAPHRLGDAILVPKVVE